MERLLLVFKILSFCMFHCFQSGPACLSTKDNGIFLKRTPSNTQVASRKSPGLKTIQHPKKISFDSRGKILLQLSLISKTIIGSTQPCSSNLNPGSPPNLFWRSSRSCWIQTLHVAGKTNPQTKTYYLKGRLEVRATARPMSEGMGQTVHFLLP